MEDNQNKDEIENVETLFEDEEVATQAPVIEPTIAPVTPVVEPTTTPAPVEPVIEPAPVAPVEQQPVTEPVPVASVEPVQEPAPAEPVTEPTPAPVAPVVEPTTAPAPEPVPAAPTVSEVAEKEEKPKKLNMKVIAIAVVVLLIACGAYLYFCTDMFKGDKNNNNSDNAKEQEPANGPADKFVGVYKAEESKLFIKKVNSTKIKFMIDENVTYEAVADGDTAKQTGEKDNYFTFKLTNEGIEVSYVSSDGTEPFADLGLYTKVGDYNKETVYKELVGDPEFLKTKYNGQYKSEKVKLDLYQISENEVMVRTSFDYDIYMYEIFTIVEDNKLVQYSFFDETIPEMEINFVDNGFTITTYDQAFGFDEEKKEFEGTYTFEKEITQDYLFDTYYKQFK